MKTEKYLPRRTDYDENCIKKKNMLIKAKVPVDKLFRGRKKKQNKKHKPK